MYFNPSQVEDEISDVKSREASQILFPDLPLSLTLYP